LVGTTLALAMTANQLAIVLAPPAFGLIYDVTGSYRVPFVAFGALLMVVSARVALEPRRALLESTSS